jgi:ABC-2 type transport system permease protein
VSAPLPHRAPPHAPPASRRARALVRASWLAFTQALAVDLTYRAALLQSLLGVGLSLVGLLAFWLAAAHGTNALGYDAPHLVAYFVVSGAVAVLHENRIAFTVATAIRMGSLAAALGRPFPFLVNVLAQATAHALLRVLLLAPFLLLAPLALEGRVAPLGAPLPVLAAALAVALACAWSAKIFLGLLAFDMTQTWGPDLVFQSLYFAFSGIGYPPDLLPVGLKAVVVWTPLYYMVGLPALLAAGRVPAADVTTELARGAVVAAAMAVVVAVRWRRGLAKFEAIGL